MWSNVGPSVNPPGRPARDRSGGQTVKPICGAPHNPTVVSILLGGAPFMSRSTPPTPRKASAARNFTCRPWSWPHATAKVAAVDLNAATFVTSAAASGQNEAGKKIWTSCSYVFMPDLPCSRVCAGPKYPLGNPMAGHTRGPNKARAGNTWEPGNYLYGNKV